MHRVPLIFDVSMGRMDDGAGIRTVVFCKGCPLRCRWCHNPESHSFAYDFMWDSGKCLGCKRCVAACARGVITLDGAGPHMDRERCDACGKCSAACPGNALKLVGKQYCVEELLELLLRDRCFYEASGGGVTFSGGEPLAFPEYVGEVARQLRAEGISVAVETCGFFEYEDFREMVLPYIDCVLYDLKLMDEQKHIHYIGVSNRKILENFRRLADERPGVKLIPRTPLIPGITDGKENLEALESFLKGVRGVAGHVLLPYNNGGERKGKMLRKEREK